MSLFLLCSTVISSKYHNSVQCLFNSFVCNAFLNACDIGFAVSWVPIIQIKKEDIYILEAGCVFLHVKEKGGCFVGPIV